MTLENRADEVSNLHTVAGNDIDTLQYLIDKDGRPEEIRGAAQSARAALEDAAEKLEQIERSGPYSIEELNEGPRLEKSENGGNTDE